MRERIRRVKVRKLMACGKDSLLGKKKSVCAFSTSHPQTFSHFGLNDIILPFPGSIDYSPHVTVIWQDKCHNSVHPHLLLLSPHLLWPYDMGWIHWSAGVSCPQCEGTAGGVSWEAKKSLAQCKYCSATTKIAVCFQHYFHHNSKT